MIPVEAHGLTFERQNLSEEGSWTSPSESETRPPDREESTPATPSDHEVLTKKNKDPIEERASEYRHSSNDFPDYLPWCDILSTANSSDNNEGAIIVYARPSHHVGVSFGLQRHLVFPSTCLVDTGHAQM